MPNRPLGTAPRSYAPGATVLRRVSRGPASAPERTTVREIESWLLTEALGEEDLLELFESLAWRLVAAGVPLDRTSLHIGTLDPQLYGFGWNWARSDGLCDEIKVPESTLSTDAYRRNPLFRVIEYGETVRASTNDPESLSRFPLVAELAAQGITEYLAVPLRAGGAYHNAATVATMHEGGFSDSQFADLGALLRLLALHVERHIAWRITSNVLVAYLGNAAAARVIRGTIRRGDGHRIHAIIWASDLRGFTDLADRLAGRETTAILNAYLERMAGAVLKHDGEVLKFIGDGLLAVFPFATFGGGDPAAAAALAAAETAICSLDALNAAPPPDLAAIGGWQPLRTGIALHEGDVFFGNVGAPERLDFTVIGREVNAASRVEALSKPLGRPILITEPVANRLDCPLEPLGEHRLKGLAEAVTLFAPRQKPSS